MKELYLEWREQFRLGRHECPKCAEPLEHFTGIEKCPEYDYCPRCNDWAYQDGQRLFRLEG